MDGKKIELFMTLAGQQVREKLSAADEKTRELGAQLLLSEVLEYVVHGLGVTPKFNGTHLSEPNSLTYHANDNPDHEEMIDGLADVAYTMYWNASAFGVPLEEAFSLVCDNNLEKFVALKDWNRGECTLDRSEWGCGRDVTWPDEVKTVSVVKVGDRYYAVGKDERGKVRKPSTYGPVDLSAVLARAVE